ncbi:MAG TPA: hypothetical protein VKQ54_04230 [Caulobacteraceae bacterium]|nr:hypothetical protein [Caulobacteraceae bacterium]
MPKIAPIAAPAPPPDPPADDPSAVVDAERLAAAVARAERRLRVLEEIAEIGMRLMRKLEDAPAKDAPRPDPAVTFAKLSRAVRLTLDLEVRAEEDLRAALAGEVRAHEKRREATRDRLADKAVAHKAEADDADETARQDARNRVEDQLELAIMRECETEKEYFERTAAMEERLEDDDAYDDVRGLPFREVVEQLCKDIGLTPDWSD